jgi:hypothetical protein
VETVRSNILPRQTGSSYRHPENWEGILVTGFKNYEASGSELERQAESRLLANMKEFVLLNVDGQLQELIFLSHTQWVSIHIDNII